MITLYELSGKNDVRFSPYCWRARMALNYKNLDFKTVPIKFTEKNLIEFSGQKFKYGNGIINPTTERTKRIIKDI
mgnify:CR=1 FL=1